MLFFIQVGFGAAGADVIGKNMSANAVNPMMPGMPLYWLISFNCYVCTHIIGKKITSVYGFCDIRQFTDTTECLQEEVMVYVNKLGKIVHGCAHLYFGMANKNVGDAFLLSWKVCDGELPGFSHFTDEPNEQTRLRANEQTR